MSVLLLVFSALQRCVSSSEVVCAFAFPVLCASTLQVVFASTLLVVCSMYVVGGETSSNCHSEGQTNVVLACLWGMQGVIQACMEHS